MELKIKPAALNKYPLHGVFIKGHSIGHWVKQVQLMGLSLEDMEAYAIPGTVANTVAGCLMITAKTVREIYSNEYCQSVYHTLFIPEKSEFFPAIAVDEIETLFAGKKHFFHPVYGFCELTEPINWKAVIEPPVLNDRQITMPAEKIFIPGMIRSFQVEAVIPEEMFKELQVNTPNTEEDKLLTKAEQLKLAMYKNLFGDTTGSGGMLGGAGMGILSGLGSLLGGMFGGGDSGSWSDMVQKDFSDLERRNQNEVDRLLELLKNDPDEALKHAIPIDSDGTNRGGSSGSLNLGNRWSDFSLGGSYGGSGRSIGGSVDVGSKLLELQAQYDKTAQDLIKQNDHYKAAFIYLKLLKNSRKAAETLVNGGFYAEAAAIYLEYLQDKQKAAEYYEKANVTLKAIELYDELHNYEKVGDLYLTLKNNTKARAYFEKVVDNYRRTSQFLKASLIRKQKMNDIVGAQILLIDGWRSGNDAFNCLNNYFNNIEDHKHYAVEIGRVYQEEVTVTNREIYLKVLKHEYRKQNEVSGLIRDMSYEIISEHISINPSVVQELQNFNAPDKQLTKDIFRFNTAR
jgi:tetratricopeptide (TPR) repeat protein